MALWEGDVLILYAVCSVFLIALHRLDARALFVLGGLAMLAAVALAIAIQPNIDTAGTDLDGFWQPGSMAGTVLAWFVADGLLRALA